MFAVAVKKHMELADFAVWRTVSRWWGHAHSTRRVGWLYSHLEILGRYESPFLNASMICSSRSKLWGQFRSGSPRGAQLESSCCPWYWFLEPFETQFSFIYPLLFGYIVWIFHVFCILIMLVSSCFSWKEYFFSTFNDVHVLWSFKVQCCLRREIKKEETWPRLISEQGQQSIMIGMFVMNQLTN